MMFLEEYLPHLEWIQIYCLVSSCACLRSLRYEQEVNECEC